MLFHQQVRAFRGWLKSVDMQTRNLSYPSYTLVFINKAFIK